jgi:hypothetical protein
MVAYSCMVELAHTMEQPETALELVEGADIAAEKVAYSVVNWVCSSSALEEPKELVLSSERLVLSVIKPLLTEEPMHWLL